MTMDAAARRARLREIVADQSLLKEGSFTLASGRSSGFFFNMKTTMLDPEGAELIADCFLDLLEDMDCDCVGGVAMGGIPLVTAVAVRGRLRHRALPAFFVRKEAKDHGTGNKIDGHLVAGGTAVILEDVSTTGGSAMVAVDAARAAGATVTRILTVVDRLEGARENLAKAEIELGAIFTRDDFKE